MRVNVYAEEITDRIQIVEKYIDGQTFTGVRFYLELPVTVSDGSGSHQLRGPFKHRPLHDDSSAVTFWGKKDFNKVFILALIKLDRHHNRKKSNAVNEGTSAMLLNTL